MDEIESDASQVLLRHARVAARTYAAAGICGAAGMETSAMTVDLAQFDAVLDLIMADACNQLRGAIVRAYPLCPPSAAEQVALEFLDAWGKTAAREGLLIARDDEAGLQHLTEERERLLGLLLAQAAGGY